MSQGDDGGERCRAPSRGAIEADYRRDAAIPYPVGYASCMIVTPRGRGDAVMRLICCYPQMQLCRQGLFVDKDWRLANGSGSRRM